MNFVMDEAMHCRRAPIYHSEMPSVNRPSDAVHVAHLEEELSRLVPVTRFHLATQPLDIMIRGLTSSGPSSARHQQRVQYLEDEEDEESDLSRMDAFSTAVVKRSKTNSERGRAFRARRKKYEDSLLTIVSSLRQEVADLDFLLSVRAEKVLRSRNSMDGSLVRLAREYFALFERGIPSLQSVGQKRPAVLTDGSGTNNTGDSFAAKQKAFLESAMDAEMQFGGASGPEYLLDQWERYTSYHSSFHVEVVSIEVSGEENDPIVTVCLNLRVVFSRATFDHVFPHVADNEEILNKFIGREVIYRSVNRFHFSTKDQILVYDTNVGFVDALVQAGANVSDIALLMQQARIADECKIGDNSNQVQELEQDNQDEITSPDDNNSHATSEKATGADSNKDSIENGGSDGEEVSSLETSSRFAIDFLLS